MEHELGSLLLDWVEGAARQFKVLVRTYGWLAGYSDAVLVQVKTPKNPSDTPSCY